MKGVRVLFGPSPPGLLGGAEVLGFEGKGYPSARAPLTRPERAAKRGKAKARRQAIRKARA